MTYCSKQSSVLFLQNTEVALEPTLWLREGVNKFVMEKDKAQKAGDQKTLS